MHHAMQVLVWHYPEAVYMDRDLLPQTISKQSPPDLGKTAEIVDFRNTRVQVRTRVPVPESATWRVGGCDPGVPEAATLCS